MRECGARIGGGVRGRHCVHSTLIVAAFLTLLAVASEVITSFLYNFPTATRRGTYTIAYSTGNKVEERSERPTTNSTFCSKFQLRTSNPARESSILVRTSKLN